MGQTSSRRGSTRRSSPLSSSQEGRAPGSRLSDLPFRISCSDVGRGVRCAAGSVTLRSWRPRPWPVRRCACQPHAWKRCRPSSAPVRWRGSSWLEQRHDPGAAGRKVIRDLGLDLVLLVMGDESARTCSDACSHDARGKKCGREDEGNEQAARRTHERPCTDDMGVVLNVDLSVQTTADEHKSVDRDHTVFRQLLDGVPIGPSGVRVGIGRNVQANRGVTLSRQDRSSPIGSHHPVVAGSRPEYSLAPAPLSPPGGDLPRGNSDHPTQRGRPSELA
jgi:hypothetical protein